MITVIGKSAKHVKKKVCPNCSNKLEYTMADTRQSKTNCDYLGGYDIVDVLDCPVCNFEIQI